MQLDDTELKVALVRRGWNRTRLAEAIGEPPTTLGSWLSGRHPAPEDLPERISKALGVSVETLSRRPATQK